MAKPILIANWKNLPNSLEEAKNLVKELRKRKESFKRLSLFIAPPYPYFEIVKNFGELASQDLSLAGRGAHTGEVGVEILKSFGVRVAILGHSERRAMGEEPAEINKKVKLALKNGITPLICIGEKEKDKDGLHFEFLRQDLKSILSGISKKEISRVALAYEPVWAVGRGSKYAIGATDLRQMVLFIKKVLTDFYGRRPAEKVVILYGGAVERPSAEVLAEVPGLRGFLIGHESLNAKGLAEIAEAL